MLLHLVAHVARNSAFGEPALSDPDVSDRFWLRLREAFPGAVAACVMPTHVHLVLPVSSGHVDSVSLRLANVLVGPSGGRWAPVTCRDVDDSVEGLLAAVSHVHFRPCRLGLVRDPLAWPWSTHRDLVGARIDPWLSEARFSSALGLDERSRRDALRSLVSGGAKARSGVLTVAPQRVRRPSLAELVRGAEAACLYVPRALKTSVSVHLARAHGYTDSWGVARAVGVSHGTIERIARSEPPLGLAAAELCALDARLTFRPTRSALRAG